MASTSLTYGIFAKDNASPVFARVSRNISSAGRQADGLSGAFSRMGGAFAFAAKAGTVALGAMATAGAVAGIKTAASLQQAQISFETLLGSAQKASAFIKDATNFASRTPFQTEDVIAYSRALLGAGQAAGDIIPTLTAWGDTSGALGQSQEQFSRTMTAVTQIMNKGKVQAEELMQISESGIPIWGELSKALHLPIPEIQGLMKEGKLLSGQVLPALQAQLEKDYGGAMAKQAQTLTGRWSTFKDTLSLGLSKAMQPLVPILDQVMPGAMAAMSAGLEKLAGFLATAIPKVQAFFTAVSNSGTLQKFIGWVQGSLIPAFERAFNKILPQAKATFGDFANTIRGNTGVFKALGTILTDFVIPYVSTLATLLLKTLGPAFKTVVWILKNVVIPAFVGMTKAFLDSADIIISAAAKAFGWVRGIGPKLKKANAEFDAWAAGVNASLASIITNLDIGVNIHVRTVSSDIAGGIDGKMMTPQQAAAANRARIAQEAAKAAQAASEKVANKTAALGKNITLGLADGLESGTDKVKKAGDKVKSAAEKKFDEIKAAAESMRDSVRDSVAGFFTLREEGNPFAGLGNMAQKAVKFANAIGRLVQQGVPSGVISAIAQLSPDQGLRAAQMLTNASKADRKRVVGAFNTIQAAADRAGGYAYRSSMGDRLSRQQLDVLKDIRSEMRKHHKANPLNAGWSAA